MNPEFHTPGRNSAKQSEGVKSSESLPSYIYYRIYVEDGVVSSKTPVAPGNPFLGRIKTRSVPPPRTAKALKRSIAKVEKIKDLESTSLFLSPFSQLPMDDAEIVTILDLTDPGCTPEEPLAFVTKLSESAGERGGLASAAESDTADVRYVYYMLYADDDQMPSKVAIDPDELSLGRIRADYITPPHTLTSFKLCLSRMERNPKLAHANIFEDISSVTPLEQSRISNLRTEGPGQSPNEPMAIVLTPPIPGPDGKYLIRNRAEDICWIAGDSGNPIKTVYFYSCTMEYARRKYNHLQWDITHDTNGNISIRSVAVPSWVGSEINGSTEPVPWRLIPADNESYYLTTDMDLDSQYPRVPALQGKDSAQGTMATLKEGDQRQMWEFIPV